MERLRGTTLKHSGRVRRAGVADGELVATILAGETQRFEEVMRRYNQRLFRLARCILGDDGEAEDVVQETYVRAFFRLAEFRGPHGLGAWLARIAANQALARRRKADWAVKRVDAMDLDQAIDQGAGDAQSMTRERGPEDQAYWVQIRRLLEAAIDDLPEHFRVVYVLREVERLSVQETADCLELTPTTVKTRVHRARRLLRERISGMVGAEIEHVFAFAGSRCDRIVDGVLRRIAGCTG